MLHHGRRRSRALPLAVGLSLLIVISLYHFLCLEIPCDITRITDAVSNDVELVVASMKHEDTSWLGEWFPHWKRSIYTVDDPTASLTVPKNKGREAMVYLTYMIDNYDNLAPYILFIHAQRFQWHNDDPDYDGVPMLRNFQFPYLRESGYVNMRCAWAVGCPSEIYPLLDEVHETKSEDITVRTIFKSAFQEILPEKEVPYMVSVSCCAQFALTREKIRSRSRDDYIRMRQWLLETPLEDSLAGRVFEYSWHIIFGLEAVNCPSAGDCYCKVYGMCDLKCEEDKCHGRYLLPPYSTLPVGWPYIGWQGELRNFAGP